ncbi:MAG: hypothetical protein WED33_07040 [Bacteroidia bacterium]
MRYYINSGLFAALLLCFFLPFLEIKCNDTSLGSMTGYSLMTAGEMNLKDASMMDYLKDNEEFNLLNNERKKHPDFFTIIAAVLLFAGAVLSLALKKYREQMAIIIAALTLTLMIVFRAMMLYQWDKQVGSQPEMLSFIKLSINFAIGYWLVVIGNAIIGGLNGYYLFKKKKVQENITEFHTKQSPDTLEEL